MVDPLNFHHLKIGDDFELPEVLPSHQPVKVFPWIFEHLGKLGHSKLDENNQTFIPQHLYENVPIFIELSPPLPIYLNEARFGDSSLHLWQRKCDPWQGTELDKSRCHFVSHNPTYNGGCLVEFCIQGQEGFLVPSGTAMNTLTFIEKLTFQEESLFKFQSRICQLEASGNHVAVRLKTSVHLLLWNINLGKLELTNSFESEEEETALLTFNRHIKDPSDELFFSTEREILFWDMNYVEPQLIAKPDDELDTFPVVTDSSHPRTIVCTCERTGVKTFDIRSAKSSPLLSRPNPVLAPDDERFVTTHRDVSTDYLYYITTTKSLFALDERYSNHPILCWTHLMNDSPIYVETAHVGQDSVIFIASQQPSEIQTFLTRKSSDFFLQSLGQQRMLRNSWDLINDPLLHLRSKKKLLAMDRLRFPMIGLAIDKTDHSGFSVYRFSSAGDLSCQQCAIIRADQASEEKVLCLSETSADSVNSWIRKVALLEENVIETDINLDIAQHGVLQRDFGAANPRTKVVDVSHTDRLTREDLDLNTMFSNILLLDSSEEADATVQDFCKKDIDRGAFDDKVSVMLNHFIDDPDLDFGVSTMKPMTQEREQEWINRKLFAVPLFTNSDGEAYLPQWAQTLDEYEWALDDIPGEEKDDEQD